MKDFTFIHVSGVYLGTSFEEPETRGPEIRQKIRENFREKITQLNARYNPDALIITRNLFGTNMYSSHDVTFVQSFFEEIDIPVFIVPGDMDEVTEVSVYNNIEFTDNVSIVKDKFEFFINNIEVRISNFYKQTEFFNIILSENNDLENNDAYYLWGNNIEYIKDKNFASIPAFDFIKDWNQKEAGIGILRSINGKLTYFLEESNYFNRKRIKINISNIENRNELNSIFSEVSGESNILKIILQGEILNSEILKYISGIQKKLEELNFSVFIEDNTEISQNFLKRIPSHLEEGLFIKHVEENFKDKKNRKSLKDEILKKGLGFFDLEI